MSNRFTSRSTEASNTLSYPEAIGTLTDADVEISDRILADWSTTDMREFCEDNTVTRYLGDRAFQMLVHTPKDFDGNVVVVPTGLGADISPGAITQAHIIREIADKNATLLVLAHASVGTSVNNFSAREAWNLQSGDPSPLLDRLNVGLDWIDDATQAVYSGASLGARTTSAALARNNDMIVPAVAGTVIEPVHVREWSDAGLGLAYARSIGDFSAVFDLDAPEGMTGKEMLEKFKVKGPRFSAKAVAEILALTGVLRWNRLGDDLNEVPEGIGIVHAWSRASKVSPHDANQEVADEMSGHPNYKSTVFRNKRSEHGITVAYPLHGALAREALQLSTAR